MSGIILKNNFLDSSNTFQDSYLNLILEKSIQILNEPKKEYKPFLADLLVSICKFKGSETILQLLIYAKELLWKKPSNSILQIVNF